MTVRTFYAGQSVEDYCRACKTDRMHTIVVVDTAGIPLRVVCGFCDSEHQYRGGPRIDVADTPPNRITASAYQRSTTASERQPLPIVAERERIGSPMSVPGGTSDLELLLRRIVREEAGVTPVVPAAKWRGGTMVLRPGTAGLQDKVIPIDALFHKIVMIRDRLRVLEQKVNAHPQLSDEDKVQMQQYVTQCYGSLTTFNVLFAERDDGFIGQKGSRED